MRYHAPPLARRLRALTAAGAAALAVACQAAPPAVPGDQPGPGFRLLADAPAPADALADAPMVELPLDAGFDLTTATRADEDDPPGDPCITGEQRTVWYRFTAATSDEVLFHLATLTPGTYASLVAYEGPPADGRLVVCAISDGQLFQLARLVAGQTYHLQVGVPEWAGAQAAGQVRLEVAAYVAPAVTGTIDPVAKVSADGQQLLVTGTIAGNKPLAGGVRVAARQASGRVYVLGEAHSAANGPLAIAGPAPTPWRVAVPARNGTWRGGPATLEVTFSGGDAFSTAEVFVPSTPIRVKR